MKKRIIISILLTFILIVGVAFGVNASKDGKTVDVMFLHDTHSHLNAFATVEGGESKTLGGFAKIKALINDQKAKNPDTLLLDAGDFSMGTLIQVMYEKQASEIRMLGQLGFDVTTLGNHEFDYGAKGLSNMLSSAVTSGDTLPTMVVCNVDWDAMEGAKLTDAQKLLKESFETYGVKEYVVVEKNGVKIAITGVFGEDALDCVPNCPLQFKNPIEAVKETVAKIKKQEEADMIVCVSHSGTWKDEKKSEDELLAKSVPELDLIISGHTHTKLDKPIVHGDTYIASAGEYGKRLGSLSMTQNADGRWEMDAYELVTVEESIDADKATQAKIDGFMSQVDSEYLSKFGYTKDQVLCTNEVEFATSEDAGELHTEVNLGSIMADAYTYTVEKYSDDDHPVDVAVVPAGVIRDTYAKGNITPENVFNSFSLGIGQDGVAGYPLISIYLTGAELKTVAEIDASISDLMSSARLYTDGLYWNYNPNRLILNKVTDVYLCNGDGERVKIQNNKLYRVVTDYYTSQMLGGVTDLSYGLLSITPKSKDGVAIINYADTIIEADGKEIKAWAAIAEYMTSFEDTDGDGIGNVPAKYGESEGRKVVEDSKNLWDLIKNPNKFAILIVSAVVLLISLFLPAIILIVRAISVRRKKKHAN